MNGHQSRGSDGEMDSRRALVVLALLLLLRPLLVHGQSYYSSENRRYRQSFSSTVAVIVVVMISAFFSMVFISVFLRRCSDGGPASNRQHLTGGGAAATARKGLEKSVVESYPMMVYSDVKEHKLGKGTLECAVCLSEFDDAETLRLLPSCNHAFHPDCIGLWLDSHTTCPVCRADLTAGAAAPAEQPAEVVIQVEVEEEAGRRNEEIERRVTWTEEERERFTLRLPEAVRAEVMSRRFDRSATMAVVRGEATRGLGKDSRGGWSFKKEWAAKSDRWAFLGRNWSLRTPRGSHRGEASGKEAETSAAVEGRS